MGFGAKNISTRLSKGQVQSYFYLKYLIAESQKLNNHIDLEKMIIDVCAKNGLNLSAHQNYNAGDLKEISLESILNDPKILPEMKDAILNDMKEINNKLLKQYSRLGGELAKEFELGDSITLDNLETIANLELGLDKRTAQDVKGKKVITRTICYTKVNNQYVVLTHQEIQNKKLIKNGKEYDLDKLKVYEKKIKLSDLKNGYFTKEETVTATNGSKNKKEVKVHFPDEEVTNYVTKIDETVKKTAIEFTFTQSSSFSYALSQMEPELREKMAQELLNLANDVFEKVIKQYLGDHNGNNEDAKFLTYSMLHVTNRENLPFYHVHFNLSNIIKLKDGSIRAIECPAITTPNFHKMIDSIYQTELATRFNEICKDTSFRMEAHDKDGEAIEPDNDFQLVDNWKINYDKDSEAKIRANSRAEQLKDEFVAFELKNLQEKFKNAKADIYKKLEPLDDLLEETTDENGKKLNFDFGEFVSIEKQNKDEDKSKFKNNVVLTFKTEDGELKKVISYRFSEAEIRSQFKPGDYIKLEEISESKSNGKKERYYKLHHANERKELLSQIEQLQFELDVLEEKYISDTQTIKSDKHRKDIWSKIKKDKVDQSLNDSFENNTKTAKEMDLKTKSLEDTADYFKPTTIEELLDNLTNTEISFNYNRLVEEFAKTTGLGLHSQEEAKKLLDKWIENGDLIPDFDPDENINDLKKQYIPKSLVLKEVKNIEIGRKFSVYKNPDQAIKDIEKLCEEKFNQVGTFAEEQKIAVKCMTENRGMALINGFPGSGKSFIMGHSIDLMSKADDKMKFFILSPTGRVAANAYADMKGFGLEEKVECMTIHSFLNAVKKGKIQLDPKTKIFVDEAGMISTKLMNGLLTEMEKARSTGVFIGDVAQISSISGSNTFREFFEDPIVSENTLFLKEITRQKDKVQLEIAQAVSFASALSEVKQNDLKEQKAQMKKYMETGKHVDDAWKLMDQAGRIVRFKTTEEKEQWLADKITSDPAKWSDKSIFCSTNNTNKRMNDKIQSMRVLSGELKTDKFVENRKRKFYEGDRVILLRNTKEKEYRYSNGDFGEIKEIHEDGSITLELDNGDKFQTDKFANMDLSYVFSVIKSQGSTFGKGQKTEEGIKFRGQCYLNAEVSMVNNQEILNVGLTRSQDATFMAVVECEEEDVKACFRRKGRTKSLIDVARNYLDIDSLLSNKQMNKEIKKDVQQQFDINKKEKGVEEAYLDRVDFTKNIDVEDKIKPYNKFSIENVLSLGKSYYLNFKRSIERLSEKNEIEKENQTNVVSTLFNRFNTFVKNSVKRTSYVFKVAKPIEVENTLNNEFIPQTIEELEEDTQKQVINKYPFVAETRENNFNSNEINQDIRTIEIDNVKSIDNAKRTNDVDLKTTENAPTVSDVKLDLTPQAKSVVENEIKRKKDGLGL